MENKTTNETKNIVIVIKNAKRYNVQKNKTIETADEIYIGSELLVEITPSKQIVRAEKRNEKSRIIYLDLNKLPKYVKKLVDTIEI